MDNIILYSTGCLRCKELKGLLDKFNIKYTLNTSVDEMLSLGFTTVPVLCVNGENMDFQKAKDWVMSRKNKGETNEE